MSDEPDVNAVVSHEQDGRVLSGVGVSADDLAATMDRHAPEPDSPAEGTSGAPPDGNASGPAPETTEKPSRGRQRFADLTREREAARAEATAANAAREAITRERDELRARLSPPAPAEAPRQQSPAPPPAFTFPEYETYVSDGHPQASYDDWRRAELFAFSDWKDQQSNLDARIRQSIDADRASRSFTDTVERTRAAAREIYSDFDALVASGPGAAVPLGPTPQEAIQRAMFVVQHPQSAHLQHAILKDGDLARRLQQMDPIAFGVAIAQLVPNGSGVSPASPAVSVRSTPPAPMQPVGTGTRTTVTPSAELVKGGFDFDKSGYREKRAAERGIRRR